MLAVQRKTPGVYVTELSAFPPSVVGIETAVPAFIGYTERADQSGKPALMKPVRISSLADFEEAFGGAPPPNFDLADAGTNPHDIAIGDKKLTVTQDAGKPRFYLYHSLQLFYANGGGTAYIVSVGDYSAAVASDKLVEGLKAIEDQVGPTMLVLPDALRITSDAEYANVAQAALRQCGKLGDRVAILDVFGADTFAPTTGADAALQKLASDFQKDVGTEQLSYGMSYFPALRTSVIQSTDMNLASFDLADANTLKALQDALKAEIAGSPQAANLTTKIDGIPTAVPARPAGAAAPSQAWTDWVALNKDLPAAIPALRQLYAVMAEKLNVLPASGAMAGVYTYVDGVRGVWNAPANISLTGVVGPTFKVTAEAQGDLNVPLNGKAINVIRDFVGRGTLVWGARTLDGNSNDYRYIQVRRTLIYIEQSIKAALDPFVFAANDGQTWVTVTAMISNFLTGLWTQGGLLGAKASEAFSVQCGLGSTMTGLDVLNGYMRVQVTLQMIRPAEFIELTFTQKMQGVG
jgi:uncharacterized protein